MKFETIKIDGDRLSISKNELNGKFHEYREKGYASQRFYRETGDAIFFDRSTRCHAIADCLCSLLSYFEAD